MNTCPFGFLIRGATTGSAAAGGPRRRLPGLRYPRRPRRRDPRSLPVRLRLRRGLPASCSTTPARAGASPGACWSAWLWFDLDAGDDLPRRPATPPAVWRPAWSSAMRIDDDALLLFFSGAKGFHVGLPTALWLPAPSADFHHAARRFAEGHAERLGIGIDAGVYDRVRPFRAPNSRHPKTGLHKRRLTFDELLGLSLDAVLRSGQDAGRLRPPDVRRAVRPGGGRTGKRRCPWSNKRAEGKAQRQQRRGQRDADAEPRHPGVHPRRRRPRATGTGCSIRPPRTSPNSVARRRWPMPCSPRPRSTAG